jgi:nucleoside-diphosphate-sugar epimerase
VEAIRLCLTCPAIKSKTYLLSDGEDLSTADLIGKLSRAMGKPVRLLNVPAGLLEIMAGVMGKRGMVKQLAYRLLVDSGRMRRELGWSPPYSIEEGLRETVDWYLAWRER